MTKVEVSRLQSLTGHRDCVYTIEPGSRQVIFSLPVAMGWWCNGTWRNQNRATSSPNLPNSVYALHYLASQDQLIAAQNFQGIHILDYRSKKEFASLKLTDSYIFDLASDKQNLIVACGNGTVLIVDLETLSVKKSIECSSQSARTISINKKRDEFVVGYSDNYIRVFDLTNYSLKREWLAHDNSVFTLCFSGDGNMLLSGSRDAKLKVWNADEGYGNAHEIAAHMYTINHIAYSPDSKHFVTCGMDKSIKVWDSQEYRLIKVIDKARHAGHGTSVNKLAWTSFNNQLVSASDDKTLSVWDIIF